MRARQFRHRSVVVLNIFNSHRTGVPGNVVRAGKNDHNFRMQIDHVLPETHQHLRRSLSSYAAVDVSLAGEIFVEMPDVGDGISEEDNAILAGRGRFEGGIGFAVAGELSEIVSEDRNARGAVLVEPSESGGRNGGLGLGRLRGLLGDAGNCEEQD